MSNVQPLPSPRPYTSRTFAQTETGAQTTYERTLESGRKVTGGATITRAEGGGVTVEATRTGQDGRTATVAREVPAEAVAAYRESLGNLAERLQGLAAPDAG